MKTASELPEPKFDRGAVCIQRQQGQVIGQVCTIESYDASAVGEFREPTVTLTDGTRYLSWDRDLVQIDPSKPLSIAAAFVESLLSDDQIANRLFTATPTVFGLSDIRIVVPSTLPGKWSVMIDSQVVASVVDNDHISALDELHKQLLLGLGSSEERGTNRSN